MPDAAGGADVAPVRDGVENERTDADPAPKDAMVVDAASDGNAGDSNAADRPPVEAAPAADATDALPGGATATVRSVLVAAGGTTMPYGGPGGVLFTDDCGTEGEVVIGYAGYKNKYSNTTNEYVIAVQIICGRLEIPSGSIAARVVSMREAPIRGDMRGTSWRALCPQDQIIVGYTSLLDDAEQTENLLFHCAPLAVAAAPPRAVVPGAVTMLSWVGKLGGGPHATTSCPAGQVGRGHVVRVGSWIDAFHITCGGLTAGP